MQVVLYIFSFVQSADDVATVRRVLDEAGGHSIGIISKVESISGLRKYEEIVDASDGVMIARGDLGMELVPWKVGTMHACIPYFYVFLITVYIA